MNQRSVATSVVFYATLGGSLLLLLVLFTTDISQGAPDRRFLSFKTPSGNIACTSISDVGIRCDIASGLRPPRTCSLGYWASIQMNGRRAARPACINDSALGSPMPVLPYGRRFRNGIVGCVVRPDGLRCTSIYGHGFFLARAGFRVY